MAISRSQMNRQLRAGGGIMDVTPRENFGLGSKFKKFVRKIIPNEVASVATKAAPFVAPFNPLLAAGMAGIGGFDQTGSIGKSLRNAALTYGGGQLARYAGGAGFQQGYNPLGGLGEGAYSLGGFQLGASPIGTETGIGKLLSDRAAEAGRNQALSNITPTSGGDYGQFVEAPFGAGDALGGEGLTGTSNILERATEGVVDKAKRSTMDITKDLFSGDFTKMGNAAKELGGKGLKAIYTKPVPGSPGETQLDKLALGATIAGAASYVEAAKLAKEAELVEDVDEYTEDMYETDKSRYTDYYSKILTPEAFGLKEGGRVKLQEGSAPSITLDSQPTEDEYGIMTLPSIESDPDSFNDDIERVAQLVAQSGNMDREAQMNNKQIAYDRIEEIAEEMAYGGNIDGVRSNLIDFFNTKVQDYTNMMKPQKADGGRIGYKGGTIILTEDELGEIGGEQGLKLKILAEKLMEDGMSESEAYEQAADSLYAKGGRVGYKIGSKPDSDDMGVMSLNIESKDGDKEIDMMMADAPGITFTSGEKSFLFKTLAGQGGSDRSFTMPQLYGVLNNPNSSKNIEDAKALKAFLKMKGFKKGGRVQYAMGSPEENAKEASGISGIPLNVNPAGATELDMRETGGFVPPVGVKEKADDIPAMLSNNEFVFTADAVRAAGGGSVNKGAKRMYDMMKSLEGKVV